MIHPIHSPPITSLKQRWTLVLHGTLTAIIVTFGLAVLFAVLATILETLTGGTYPRLAMPALIWLFGAPVWLVGLLLGAPCATLLLRAGKAGPLVTIACGAGLGAGLNFAILPHEGQGFTIFGALMGIVFAAPYWAGVYRKTGKLAARGN